MDTNEEYGKRGDDEQGNQPQPHYKSKSRPPYELYGQGITEANRGWVEAIVVSIRNARGKILVAVVVVLALCKIACEFLETGSNNLSYKSIIGTLLVAGMVLTIGLISLRRVKNTDVGQKEDREKGKVESAESGTGGISPGQNRRPSTRNRGPDTNGGSE